MDELYTPAPREESANTHSGPETEWWLRYQYDLYDWDDPNFKKANRGKNAFRPIPLTHGYCMLVSPPDYRRMTQYPDGSPKTWYAKIDRDERGNILKVYARRHGRDDEPKYVYAHRELINCLHKSGTVDHVNGEGLDNRKKVNLHWHKNRRVNNHNVVRKRKANIGLPAGVEPRGKNSSGIPLYGGIRCVRLGPHRVKVIRTKRTWKSPQPAARWYQNQLKRLHNKRSSWVSNPYSVNYAVMPPRMESEPLPLPSRRRVRVEKQFEEIPFP